MNTKLVAAIAAGTLLLGGGVYVATSSDTQTEGTSTSAAQASKPANERSANAATEATEADTSTDSGTAQERPGAYVMAGENDIASIRNDKRVLFFHASWCSTCKALASDIESNATDIPAGVTIAQVDYDEATDLRKKYGVTVQHTLVQIDDAGNEIATWSGSRNLASLVAEIQ
jgi:thioredoxin 1